MHSVTFIMKNEAYRAGGVLPWVFWFFFFSEDKMMVDWSPWPGSSLWTCLWLRIPWKGPEYRRWHCGKRMRLGESRHCNLLGWCTGVFSKCLWVLLGSSMKWEALFHTACITGLLCDDACENAFLAIKPCKNVPDKLVDATGGLVWEKGKHWGDLTSSVSPSNFGKCDFSNLFPLSLVWGKKINLFF